ncbi:hypothetical protein D349_01619 [Enterococcus faecalis UP2S-6]|nr:hypothetical protein D349_01619 [Enterococcus faecalis UP2S-6]
MLISVTLNIGSASFFVVKDKEKVILKKYNMFIGSLLSLILLSSCSIGVSSKNRASESSTEVAKTKPIVEYRQGETLALEDMSIEELYKIFGNNVDERISFFTTNYNENDTFVVLDDYTLLNGKAVTEMAEVNSNTDPHRFNLKQLKEILTKNKEELSNFDK